MGKFTDLTGQVFGHLEVKAIAPSTVAGSARWFCKCLKCGSDHISPAANLRAGRAIECAKCVNERRAETLRKQACLRKEMNIRKSVTARKHSGVKETRTERHYRAMLGKGIRLHPDNRIRLDNFMEVRLYDLLIGRNVDLVSQEGRV